MTVRYRKAMTESRVTAPMSNLATSPVPMAMTARTRPPRIIWRPGRHERALRKGRPMRGEQRAGRPRNGDSRQKSRPTGSSAPVPPTIDGAARTATPTKPDRDADDGQAWQPLAEEDPAEDGDPDRHRGDEQGGDPGRHRLLGERDESHPAAEQQGSDDRAVTHLASGRDHERATVARDRPRQQDQAGQQEAGRGHDERRDRLDRDRDAEVRRAPDEVEDEHPEPDRSARSANSGASMPLA